MDNYSLSDLAAATGNGADGWGGNSAWVLIILFAMIFGGGGFGWGNNKSNGYQPQYATQDFVQNGFNFNDLQSQNRDIVSAISQNGYDTSTAIGNALASITATVKDSAYQNLTQSRDIEAAVNAGFAEQQKCCCETLRAIDGVNYNGAINTAAINANTTAQTQKILDAISGNRMADMQNQINQLQLQSAMCGVVRFPNAATYNAGTSPFFGGCGCNI